MATGVPQDVALPPAAAAGAEREVSGAPGLAMLVLGIVALGGAIKLHTLHARLAPAAAPMLEYVLVLVAALVLIGLTPVAPGEARVVQLFGRYAGTVRTAGLRWVNPFARRIRVSTRIRNHETAVAKVNDGEGNPIDIAAVVVWQVADTARALYGVDDLVQFVAMQSDAAVRHIAAGFPYEPRALGQRSLRTHTQEIADGLSVEIADRVRPAGVRVIESRITRLAYAPEIAHAMLQRQQADAVVAARQRIVEGAVGMVEMALNRLAEEQIVDLDEERKAAMVSNLLVVLCSDRATQPVVNTGTLYQ